MYILFGVLIIICIIFVCLGFYKKKCIIRKLHQMNECEKVCLLNKILMPFGFCYQKKQDVVTTTVDAWQRQFGYRSLYDRTAPCFGMVFDCEPIYFYYGERTYRIELWKGQYGINLGGEMGIYYAEGCLTPREFDEAPFRSVPDEEMLVLEMELYHKGQRVFDCTRLHWWLAGFCVGGYCEPEDIAMKVSVTFRDTRMLSCFVESLFHMGYQKCDISICNMTVTFVYSCPRTKQPRCCRCLRVRWSQWKNRLFCKLYLCVTGKFSCTLDRILYLYFFLPAAFRRLFLCKRNRKQKYRKKKKVVRSGGV